MKTKKKTKTKILTALFIIAFIALYAYIYVVPKVTDAFTETYSVEYGVLEIGEECEYLIVRDERVHTSDQSGQVDRVVDAGKLMRKNSRIVTVGSTAYYSQMRGIISYYYDGLEDVYTPDDMENIEISALDTKNEEGEEKYPVKDCVTGTASSGDPVFKVVDNKAWYLICWLDPKKAEDFTAGKNVSVRFGDGGLVQMKVHQAAQQNRKFQIILSCDRYYEEFDHIRTGTCTLIKSSKNGLLLETDSIVEVDGQKGVYVVNKLGAAHFVPVSILSSDGKTTAVEKNQYFDSEAKTFKSTVETYDQILRINDEVLAALKEQARAAAKTEAKTEDKTEEDTKGSEEDAN